MAHKQNEKGFWAGASGAAAHCKLLYEHAHTAVRNLALECGSCVGVSPSPGVWKDSVCTQHYNVQPGAGDKAGHAGEILVGVGMACELCTCGEWGRQG